MPQNGKIQIGQITFLRFLAALAIVVFHYGRDQFPFSLWPLNQIVERANIGVSFFFFLSGFVMIIAYAPGSSGFDRYGYWKNRFARIVPLYLFALLGTCLLLFSANQTLSLRDLTLSVLFVQSWVPGHALSLNVPGWSLSTEAFFYIVFPFVFLWLSRTGFKQILIGICAFWIVNQVVYLLLLNNQPAEFLDIPSRRDLLLYFPPLHLGTFLAGTLAGVYFRRSPDNLVRTYPLTAFVIGSMLLLTLLVFEPGKHHYHNGLLVPAFALIVLGLSWGRGWLPRLLAHRPFVLAGEISYGIYILQWPAHLLYSRVVTMSGATGKIPGWVFPLALIGASWVCYSIIEVPARRWLRTQKTKDKT